MGHITSGQEAISAYLGSTEKLQNAAERLPSLTQALGPSSGYLNRGGAQSLNLLEEIIAMTDDSVRKTQEARAHLDAYIRMEAQTHQEQRIRTQLVSEAQQAQELQAGLLRMWIKTWMAITSQSISFSGYRIPVLPSHKHSSEIIDATGIDVE